MFTSSRSWFSSTGEDFLYSPNSLIILKVKRNELVLSSVCALRDYNSKDLRDRCRWCIWFRSEIEIVDDVRFESIHWTRHWRNCHLDEWISSSIASLIFHWLRSTIDANVFFSSNSAYCLSFSVDSVYSFFPTCATLSLFPFLFVFDCRRSFRCHVLHGEMSIHFFIQNSSYILTDKLLLLCDCKWCSI